MNTTATNTSTTAPVVPAGGRRKARLLGVVAALFGVLFMLFGQAAPAQAAGSQSTGIYFCTKANSAVTLQVWTSSGWSNYRNGTSGSTGCGTFRYVDAGYHYQVARTVAYGDRYCWSARYVDLYTTNWYTARAGVVLNFGNLVYRNTTRIC